LYERKELFSYQKSLFDNLVIYDDDNEDSTTQLKTRNIYYFREFSELKTSLQVSFLLPFLLSQVFLIDGFSSKVTFYHPAIISEFFQQIDVIQSKLEGNTDLFIDLLKNKSPELANYFKQIPTMPGHISELPSWFIQNFQGLEHYKGFVWTTEFLYHLFILHQRLFLNFPTFISGKQGIGKLKF
jgi:hypothetical protein